MNDPSQLFRLLAPYQGQDLNEKTPVKYAAEYFDFLFNINSKDYGELINATELVIDHSKNKRQDLTNFIQGAILSRPYGLNKYTPQIASIADKDYTNISAVINSWLENEFRQAHHELFQKINHLAYVNDNTPFDIRNSRNPSEVQQIVKKTNSCMNNDPLTFFEQVTSDVGTIYLLAVQRDQKDDFRDMMRGEPNLGYIQLSPYHSEDKKEILLSVDHIWITNNNKNIVCSLMESLADISKHLDLPVIDKTMSQNYIIKNGHLLDIYSQTRNLFKLGHVPEIMRYNKLVIPKDDDGFYIIKSIPDCK